jgi:hypothetical protein
MKKILKRAVASMLFNELIKHFDDIESMMSIQKEPVFKIILDVQELIENSGVCVECEDDIDYDIVISAWNEIRESVEKLNLNYQSFIDFIKKEFDLVSSDDFLIAGTIYNHEKFLKNRVDGDYLHDFCSYISGLDEIILSFRLKILNYARVDAQDDFFADSFMIDEKNIKFIKFDFIGASVYLDNNIIQDSRFDERFRRDANEKGFNFFYSSYTIEDAINSNPIFFSTFVKDLLAITNGNMVGYMDEGLVFVKENIRDTICRVEKYRGLTKKFEKDVFSKFFMNYHLHPELRKGGDFSNKFSKNPISFLENAEKKSVSGFEKVLCFFYDCEWLVELIETGKVGAIDSNRDAIEKLLELFDFVNFKTEAVKFSNIKKIVSAYRDKCHLEHAYICDYFVTNDERLVARAKIVYPLLGIETKIMTLNEFKDFVRN